MSKIQKNNNGSYLNIDDFIDLPVEDQDAQKRAKALGEDEDKNGK